MTQEVSRQLVELAERARAALTPSDWVRLRDLAAAVAAHDGPFAHWVAPKRRDDGVIEMGYAVEGPLMSQAMKTLCDLELIVPFAWPEWEEGRRLGRDGIDPSTLSWAQTVGVCTALTRQDRFAEGLLAGVFEDGTMPRLLLRLADFAPEPSDPTAHLVHPHRDPRPESPDHRSCL